MPWVDCTALRYHCKALPKVDLCPRAFVEGRFPGGTSWKDFVRIQAPVEQARPLPASLNPLEGRRAHEGTR